MLAAAGAGRGGGHRPGPSQRDGSADYGRRHPSHPPGPNSQSESGPEVTVTYRMASGGSWDSDIRVPFAAPSLSRGALRGALRPHVGARAGRDALASRRGLARPGRALGAPPACAFAWLPFSRTPVTGLPARDGPGLGSVGCSPDKPVLLISSSHEKQMATRPRACRDREFFKSMNRNEGIASVPSISRHAHPLGDTEPPRPPQRHQYQRRY